MSGVCSGVCRGVCCSVLQSVAGCCSKSIGEKDLRHDGSVLQCVAVCCGDRCVCFSANSSTER